jgi:hypothetical protein
MFRSLVSFTAGIYVAQRYRDQVPDITKIIDGIGRDIQAKINEYNGQDPSSNSNNYNKPTVSQIANVPLGTPIPNANQSTQSIQPTQAVQQPSGGITWWWPK